MRAKELMQDKVLTVSEDDVADDLLDVFVTEHIHGAPVLDGKGKLVGIVTQQDLLFGSMTKGTAKPRGAADAGKPKQVCVRDIMTAPAVSASEDTDVKRLCRMMYELRIHRVPITRQGKVTGIVSSLDVCGALARDESV